MDPHTNQNIPSGVKITRRGDTLILKFRLTSFVLPVKGAERLAHAILELTQSQD